MKPASSLARSLSAPCKPLLTAGRRAVAITALSLFLCSGVARLEAQQGSGCIGYCGNGIAVGIGAIAGGLAVVGIALAVNHDHHFVKGCVSAGAGGPQLQTSDSTMYSLEGDPAAIKVGEMVKFHGSKVRKPKGSVTRVFRVDKLKKDYGPCQAKPVQPPAIGAD